MSDTTESPWRDEGLAAFSRDEGDAPATRESSGRASRLHRGALVDFQPELTREPAARQKQTPSLDAPWRAPSLRALPQREAASSEPPIVRDTPRRVVQIGITLVCLIASLVLALVFAGRS